jgi:ribulose-phosphate 3-epimerase
VPWREWIRTVEVEPSIYAGDFLRLGEQLDVLLRAGVRVFHFDVGDGHFIPPVTIGPVVLRSIAAVVHAAGAVIDCHLMVEGPERQFAEIASSGGDSVTVHYEACPDLPATVALAREHGLQVGLAFNPETEPEDAAAAADGVDLVLCMSIHPGYSGQAFMPEALGRVARLRGLLPESTPIQVDGGVGPDNIGALHDAGASLFVAGSAIFGKEDLTRAYRRLVQQIVPD